MEANGKKVETDGLLMKAGMNEDGTSHEPARNEQNILAW